MRIDLTQYPVHWVKNKARNSWPESKTVRLPRVMENEKCVGRLDGTTEVLRGSPEGVPLNQPYVFGLEIL